MIITCPQCSARFAVKTEAIGEKGRRVKCAKCAHAWFQAPDVEALAALVAAAPQEPPVAVEPIPQGSNVPVVHNHGMPLFAKFGLAAASFAFMLGMVIVNANSILPGFSSFYGAFGIYDSKQLALSDVTIQKIEDGNNQDIVVSGKIINESDKPKHLPNIRLTVLNANHEKIKTITLDSEGAKIEPGEGIDFQNRIARINKDSTTVVMDLGNSLDLASR
ncbi:MAG: hypothetical protein K0R98_1743 [Rickettsiaceae bacterium]|nr:hypothetical protein [Rickettsiaceae bacterium]